MGCHPEMTTQPGRDYPIGASYQPHEPVLQMTTTQLAAIHAAAGSIADRPGAYGYDDVIICHGRCGPAVAWQLVRAVWGRLRNRVARDAR